MHLKSDPPISLLPKLCQSTPTADFWIRAWTAQFGKSLEEPLVQVCGFPYPEIPQLHSSEIHPSDVAPGTWKINKLLFAFSSNSYAF